MHNHTASTSIKQNLKILEEIETYLCEALTHLSVHDRMDTEIM